MAIERPDAIAGILADDAMTERHFHYPEMDAAGADATAMEASSRSRLGCEEIP
ncbi:MAG: hypothetical protein HEQ23_10205 [Tepidisphaera sp.]